MNAAGLKEMQTWEQGWPGFCGLQMGSWHPAYQALLSGAAASEAVVPEAEAQAWGKPQTLQELVPPLPRLLQI